MAISSVAQTFASFAAATSDSITLPSWTYQSGDLLIIQFFARNNSVISATGWNQITGAAAIANAAVESSFLWKYAASGDPGTAVAVTLSQSTASVGAAYVLRGAHPTAPIGNVSTNQSGATTGTTATANGITASAGSGVLLCFGADDAWTYGAPTGTGAGTINEIIQGVSGAVGGAAGRSLSAFLEQRTSAGATNNRSVTASVGNADIWTGSMIEILAGATPPAAPTGLVAQGFYE